MKKCKSFFSGLLNFESRTFSFIAYPQYLLFVIETLFCVAIIWHSVFDKSLEIVSIWNVIRIIFILVCFFWVLYRIWINKDVNYSGIFKDKVPEEIKKQKLNYIKGGARFLSNPFRWFEENFQYYFIFLVFFFIICSLIEPGHPQINGYGIIGGIIFSICEILLNVFCISPFISIFSILGLSVVLTLIGNESSILNWAFLGLVLITTIGGNFFDKTLIEERFTKEIKDVDIIFRKITHYIGIVFLYVGIYISGYITTSPSYFVLAESMFTSKFAFLNFLYSKLLEIIIKTLIFLLVWVTYLRTKNKILYYIFKWWYRDKKLKIGGKLVPVLLEGKKWISDEHYLKHVSKIHPLCIDSKDEKELKKIKRIGINTYQKENDLFYVEKGSEILNKINRKPKYSGYPLLGKLDGLTITLIILILIIIPINKYIDSLVTVDDGIYEIVGKSDKAEFPNKIEVLGDAIVYKDKVEAYDKRTQSFEHGTISLRKKGEQSIELIENIGDKTIVKYQKKK